MCIASTLTKWNVSGVSLDGFVCCVVPHPTPFPREFSFREPSVEFDRQLMKLSEMFTAYIENHWGPDCLFSQVHRGGGGGQSPSLHLLRQKQSQKGGYRRARVTCEAG